MLWNKSDQYQAIRVWPTNKNTLHFRTDNQWLIILKPLLALIGLTERYFTQSRPFEDGACTKGEVFTDEAAVISTSLELSVGISRQTVNAMTQQK